MIDLSCLVIQQSDDLTPIRVRRDETSDPTLLIPHSGQSDPLRPDSGRWPAGDGE